MLFTRLSFICFLLLIVPLCFAQNIKDDGIKRNIEQSCEQKHILLLDKAEELYYVDAAKSLEAGEKLLKLAEICKNNEIYFSAYQSLGWAYLLLSNFPETIKYAEKALQKALEIDDKSKIINSYNLLGNIYLEIPDAEFALNAFNNGINVALSINDNESINLLYNNLAIVYEHLEDLDTSLEYYLKVKAHYEKTGKKRDLGSIYINLGDLYLQQDKIDSAEIYQKLARQHLDLKSDCDFVSILFHGISDREMKKGNLKSATLYMDSSFQCLGNAHALTDYLNYYKSISEIQYKARKPVEAYNNLLKAYGLKDSILSKEVHNKLRDVQIAAATAKKESQIQTLLKEKEIQNLKLSENKATQKNFILIVGIISLALVFLVFVVFNNKRNNTSLKARNEIIEKQSEDIFNKNSQLIHYNKEIIDSINYAKRLQEAILPSEKMIKENLPDSFIFFKPKDIVAGDFYWTTAKDDCLYFACCDSTGHGVPGAFMSLLNISYLNEAINERGIKAPNDVLNHVRQKLIENMEGSHDGMDGTIVRIENNSFSYASAYQKPILIRNNELIELKSDKMPIGKGELMKPFNLYSYQLEKDDLIYLFTDGFADQFGGENKKKYKAANLKKLLLSICNVPIEEQSKLFETHFEQWKGELDQVDDVTIIGFKV
ncbi:MAG: SpoIIE family protein phosphatase [Bacteroidota bacterium]|nr:SpoIIE family protein phosphatase [Bacteroidota bacterium]